MTSKFGYSLRWLLLFAFVVIAAAIVAVPVWLIQPFAAQSPRDIEIGYLLRSWSPLATIILAIAAGVTAVSIWQNSRRWFARAALFAPLALILVFTWFARQNHFEWMFNPLAQSRFAKVSETNFVDDTDMVLAVNINGDAVAFPVRQMAYHHVVQDVVGGTPITATY